MPLVPNFSVSQSLGNPSVLTFTDTSTGSDSAIEQRRIYLEKADGTLITGNFIGWLYPDSPVEFDVLNRDYGLKVKVEWLDGSNNILYVKIYEMGFVAYTSNFINELTQQETALPNIVGGINYWSSKAELILLVDNVNKAIALGADYKKTQVFLNNAYEMISNQTKYF
jgi:hypothetical protein